MSTKNKILTILNDNKGKNISGEALANMLGLSRTSIWKGINSLRKDGYDIIGGTNLGYSLSENNDVLSKDGIINALQKLYFDENFHSSFMDLSDKNFNKIIFFQSIDSTNTEAKRMLLEDNSIPESIIIADEQSGGRGRLGRTFESPKGGGIYISFILKPFVKKEKSLLITLAASICVRNAIRKVTGLDPKIKWVNDIFIENKKIAGILTEAVMNFETGAIENIVVGIGINCNTDSCRFTSDVQKIAGSLSDFTDTETPIDRNALTAALIQEISKISDIISSEDFIDDYKKSCFVIGKYVKFIRSSSMATPDELESAPTAKVLDISDTGALIVEHSDGSIENLSNGEITVKA